MEKKILRVLFVDDSPDDTERASEALRRAGFMLKSQRVQDLSGFQAALERGGLDAVITETRLARLTAPHVLGLARQIDAELAVIVFAATPGDDAAMTRLVHNGVGDVVRKDDPARLALAVERERRAVDERRRLRAAEQAVTELNVKLAALTEGARDPIGYCQDGIHIDANPAYVKLFGYDSVADLEGVPVLGLIDPADHGRLKEAFRAAGKGGLSEWEECTVLRRDGTGLPVEVSVAAVSVRGTAGFQVTFRDLSRRKAAETRLQYLSQHDPLTGLYNRHFFLQELTRTVERARGGGPGGALLFFDLQPLNEINNELGFAAGDRLLVRLARLFREEIGDRGLVARLSGEEFAILLTSGAREAAEACAESLRQTLKRASFTEGGRCYHCECELGLAMIDGETESAHKALVAAGMGRRPSLLPHAAPSGEAADDKADAARAPVSADPLEPPRRRVRELLKRGAFRVFYQPIVALHAEAGQNYQVFLAADGEGPSPVTSRLPSVAASGLSDKLDRWLIDRLAVTIADRRWKDQEINLFVTLAPQTVRDPDFPSFIEQTLVRRRIPAKALIPMVEEQVLVDEPERVIAFGQSLHRAGFRLAVADYGGRLAAVSHLRELPVEFLFFHPAVTRGLEKDEVSQLLTQTLLQAGRLLGKQVVVTGVGNPEGFQLLWQYGVDYAQGDFFQPPVPEMNYAFEGEPLTAQAGAGWLPGGGKV